MRRATLLRKPGQKPVKAIWLPCTVHLRAHTEAEMRLPWVARKRVERRELAMVFSKKARKLRRVFLFKSAPMQKRGP
jgi:hypothetical protein